MTDKTHPIEIPLDKKKLTLFFLGSIAFVIGGLWAIVNSYTNNGSNFAYLIGISSVLFFGYVGVGYGLKILDKKPGLVIDSFGITENSSSVSVGQISWSDIEYIRVLKFNKDRFIAIQVKNPEDYIARQTCRIKRYLMQSNWSGTPLTIVAGSLKIKFDDLLEILNHELKTRKKI